MTKQSKPQKKKTTVREAVGAEASKAEEYLAGWKRARAELDNYRKRVQGEQVQVNERNQAALVKPLLELSDTFHAMLEATPKELVDHAWVTGVHQVGRQLKAILAEYRVEEITPQGKPFDPNFHEAVSQVPSESVPAGNVVEVLQAGYVMGETVIRPARVAVAISEEK